MNTQATVLIQSLGWALLHSLWQVLLIYCSLRVVLKVSANVTARLKYHLSVVALAGSFAWFINTCFAQYERLKGVTIHVTQTGADPAATKSYALTTLPTGTYSSTTLYNITAGIEPYFPVLISLYIIGITFLLLRFFVNLLQVRSIKRTGISNVDAYWTTCVAEWQDKLDISRNVQLFFSDKINVPMTMGAFKPVILLPIAAINNLTQDQLEAILLHELAHIKRHDYLLNIIQTIVETILFFNPFIWLISRIIRKEREHCCDDMVLSYINTPLPYARALAELEISRTHTLALAATGNKHQLLNRIKRIMEMKKKPVNYTQFGVAAILITALILSIAWFTPAMAQTKKTVTKDQKGNKAVTKTVTTKNGVSTTAQTIIIKDVKDNDGVHPNDVGNAEHIRKSIQQSLEGITFGEMDEEIKAALANIDLDDLGTGPNTTITKVNVDKIGEEVAAAMTEIDWDEIENEIKKATKEVKNVDWKEVGKEIKEATSAIRTYTISPNGDITSDHISIKSGDLDKMVKEMEKDGVINRNKGFNIKYEDGILIIDGRKQAGSKTEKYMKYIEDDSQVIIKGSKDNTDITVNINK